MKNLEKYFSTFWLKCIFRIVASELLLTAFFLFFGNSFNAKLWSEEERKYYALLSIVQILINITLVYFESLPAENEIENIKLEEKSNVFVGAEIEQN